MKRKSESKHIVDVLFVLALFCLFAIYAVLLIIVGAKVYQKTIDGMEANFNTRTPYSYITEKIRQSDRSGAISVGKIEEYDALILTEEIQDRKYCTYIYAKDGYMKEFMTAKGNVLTPDAGQNIVPVADFHVLQNTDGLFEITITDTDNQILHVTLASKCTAKE